MIFHENRLPTDDSQVISYLIFLEKWGLRVNRENTTNYETRLKYFSKMPDCFKFGGGGDRGSYMSVHV